jgi:hypothetical protein
VDKEWTMQRLRDIGPEGEIYSDGDIYVDPELDALDDPLDDPAP